MPARASRALTSLPLASLALPALASLALPGRARALARRALAVPALAALLAGPAAAGPLDPGALFREACLGTAPDLVRMAERLPPALRPVEPAAPRTPHIADPTVFRMWSSGDPAAKAEGDVHVQQTRGRVGPYAADGCVVFSAGLTRADAEAAVAAELADAEFLYASEGDLFGPSRTFVSGRTWGGDRYALLTVAWFEPFGGGPQRGAVLVTEVIDFGDVDLAAPLPVDTTGLLEALREIVAKRRLRT